MFTGIIEAVGTVRDIEHHGDHARLHLEAPTIVEDASIGDSIAVDGCCLTITTLPGNSFTADLMAETMRATSLGDLSVGATVNLERAMRGDTRFGGHLVQGHVDAVGQVVARDEQPGTVFLSIAAPPELTRYLVPKGSITVSGVSLTIVDITADGVLRIGLIPHTLDVTTLHGMAPGDRVNLEVDVIAKYVERLLQAGVATPYTSMTPPAGRSAGNPEESP
jgi:riboflavin synthase